MARHSRGTAGIAVTALALLVTATVGACADDADGDASDVGDAAHGGEGSLQGERHPAGTAGPLDRVPSTEKPDTAASPSDRPASDDSGEQCRITTRMEHYLGSERLGPVLADSPMAPAIAAANAGARMPRLAPAAAEWSYTEDLYALDALTVAVALHCPDLVEQLLDLGAPPDGNVIEVYDWARTPAMDAAAHHRADLVLLLLEAGADPIRPTPGELDRTVLDGVASFGDADLVRTVLDYVHDRVPPHVAAQPDGPIARALRAASRDTDVLELLLDTGARPPARTLVSAATHDVGPEAFDLLYEAAQAHEYDDLETHVRETVCAAGQDGTEHRFRPGDLERLTDLLEAKRIC